MIICSPVGSLTINLDHSLIFSYLFNHYFSSDWKTFATSKSLEKIRKSEKINAQHSSQDLVLLVSNRYRAVNFLDCGCTTKFKSCRSLITTVIFLLWRKKWGSPENCTLVVTMWSNLNLAEIHMPIIFKVQSLSFYSISTTSWKPTKPQKHSYQHQYYSPQT